jgi:hypothetical protein
MANADNLVGHGFDKNPSRINKKGRPKKLPELDQLIIELLGERGKESRMREILCSLIELAVGGNLRAAEMILTRAYGKPKETVDITTNGKELRPWEKNRLILGTAGDIRDEYGNFVCDLPEDKFPLFDWSGQIHFVDSDGVQAHNYDGTGIISTKDD